MLLSRLANHSKLIGELYEIRRAWGFSPEVIADRVGISARTIRYAEMGHRYPCIDTIELWAEALGYDVVLRPKP